MSAERQLCLAIPNRNGARYLETTLKSLEDNRPFVRWYFQDCCSSDDSLVLARSYATPDDTIVVERDDGQANALNRAIDRMGGEIIGFLNADDCLTEGAAEAVIRTFQEAPDVDLVYGNVEWIDGAGVGCGVHTGNISNLSDILDIYNVWWRGRQWVQPEVFWRRRVWEKVGHLNEAYDLAFDYEYWLRCFQAGVRVKKLPRVLAQFRRHAAQKSQRSKQAADEIRDAVSKALASKPPIGLWERFRLTSLLSYDKYQSVPDNEGDARPAFLWTLVSNPAWFTIPEVRERIWKSCMARLQNVGAKT
jgi:glycosyltransferase involved in cell wall biosynthesis